MLIKICCTIYDEGHDKQNLTSYDVFTDNQKESPWALILVLFTIFYQCFYFIVNSSFRFF